MPAPTDDVIERRRALKDFELLLQRSSNYFQLPAERQWEVDKDLGALDAFCEERYITTEMRQQ